MSKLSILHWNDVYRVSPQKVSPTSTETIDVTQFAALLDDVRSKWEQRVDGPRDGLSLFSGDVFSPSTESSITRGSHMVPVLNVLAPDVAVTGNHDFDFGYPHLSNLIKDTKFPWLLSNIVDTTTSKPPDCLHEYHVLERAGIRVGIIGLVEQEWITTVPSWPANFEYRDMTEVGMKLSKLLRDPQGEHKCDIIIALTHSRLPNDISLAKSLSAFSPVSQQKTPIANLEGVDILLGGHDHMYFVSKGVTAWDGFDTSQPVLGAEDDEGDVLVVKSGCDFRDCSEITLELESTAPGNVRKKVIKSITGKRHTIQPNFRSSETMAKLLETLLSSVSSALQAPVCKASVEIDVRSELIRMCETSAANWFADMVRHAYDDALCLKGCGGSDGALLCAGTLRGDAIHGPGVITLGEIMEILPFEDPLVVLELDGEALWGAFEEALAKWPALEGRFPIISGIRMAWDGSKPPGQRVVALFLADEQPDSDSEPEDEDAESERDGEEVKRERGGRKYKIVTREYMAQGHDGFSSLKGQPYLIGEESGQMMSTIVRNYLLGTRFARKFKLVGDNARKLQPESRSAISREQARQAHSDKGEKSTAAERWKRAINWIVYRSSAHYRDLYTVAGSENLSSADCFDGSAARAGEQGAVDMAEDYLITVSPVVDGRMPNIGRRNTILDLVY